MPNGLHDVAGVDGHVDGPAVSEAAWFGAFLRMQGWREAIASVSLSHEPTCTCEICEAAKGDEEAFLRVVAELEIQEAKRGCRR